MDKLPDDLPLPMSPKFYNLINAICKLTRDDWKTWCLRHGAGSHLAGHFVVCEQLLRTNTETGGRLETGGWRVGYMLPVEHEATVKAILSGTLTEDLTLVA
jgi:hypothetical protein